MDNINTTCSTFMSLIKQYQLTYICENYNIYCDDTCAENINANCYCYCDENTIYCINSYYYYFRLMSVILFGLFLSCICCIFYNTFIKNKNIENEQIPPAYQEIYVEQNNKDEKEKEIQ